METSQELTVRIGMRKKRNTCNECRDSATEECSNRTLHLLMGFFQIGHGVLAIAQHSFIAGMLVSNGSEVLLGAAVLAGYLTMAPNHFNKIGVWLTSCANSGNARFHPTSCEISMPP